MSIDVIRGLAILFILIENMASYAGYQHDLGTVTGVVDRTITVLVLFLLQVKSYSLLSLLFGWGVGLQHERAVRQGRRFGWFHVWRLAILFSFGLVHGILLWHGDVLVLYAVLGLWLLLFVGRSPRTILIAAALFLAFNVVLNVPGEAMDAVRSWYASATAFMRSERYPATLYATGTYSEVTRLRIQSLLAGSSWLLYYMGSMVGMFLLGLYAAKRRLLRDVQDHVPLVRTLMLASLGVGLLFNELYVEACLWRWEIPVQYTRVIQVGTRTVGGAAFVLFYVSAILLLMRRPKVRDRLVAIAQVGQMSLSNYLFQSFLVTFLCYGYGLGLYGQFGVAFGLVLAIVVYYVQVRLSGWWLDRYQYGPVEWLWRTLTYTRRIPLAIGKDLQDQPSGDWRRLRQRISQIDRRYLYGGGVVVVVVAVIAGVLLVRRSGVEIVVQTRETVVRVTATPVVVQRAETFEVATPVVMPVSYAPGPMAAAGDVVALANAFDPERALDEIETLTSHPYWGRKPGSPGGVAAGEYIAKRFAEYGLQPAGDDGTFFQSFPIEYVALASEPSLVVTTTAGVVHTGFVPYQDLSPVARRYAGEGRAAGQVIWGSGCSHEDLSTVDVADKIVLCRNGPIIDIERRAIEHGAVGLLLLTDPDQRPPDFGAVYGEPWIPEPLPTLRVFPSVAAAIVDESGLSVAELLSSFEAFPLDAQISMQVETVGREACERTGCVGRNVLGVLPGRDPQHAHEVVVFGGHYDHLGESPGGTAWVGANDNASGVAVMLEIARVWHEQGFVPRRTILFGAWDAEEMGLIGSRFYASQPSYPLDETIAMLQLDMVGAGTDLLRIDGEAVMGQELAAVAEQLGVTTALSRDGRSDHVPFWQAGIPANCLIWSSDPDSVPTYHRPGDVLATIEADKLGMVGSISSIALLGLAEAELNIEDLLVERATAIVDGDLEAFLRTSVQRERGDDAFWFSDVQLCNPVSATMMAHELQVLGAAAVADVRTSVTCGDVQEGNPERLQAIVSARLEHTGLGWQWAGIDLDLEQTDPEAIFRVGRMSGMLGNLDGLGEEADRRYRGIADLLGVPLSSEATIEVFDSVASLRADTALVHAGDSSTWITADTIKLVYTREMSQSERLSDALVQFVLAESGVSVETLPWLWQGLPLLLRTELGFPQLQYAIELQDAFVEGGQPDGEAASWAAVAYLQRQIGWDGLGALIREVGSACEAGQCDTPQEMDAILSEHLGVTLSEFDEAWLLSWRNKIDSVQQGIDQLLVGRSAAIMANDRSAFLETVDSTVPGLLVEQTYWFDNAVAQPIQTMTWRGRPLSIAPDGRILATVDIFYTTEGSDESRGVTGLQVALSPSNGTVKWAGIPLAILEQGDVQVLHSPGTEGVAGAVLAEVNEIRSRLEPHMHSSFDPVAVKLYDRGTLEHSVGLFLGGETLTAWTAPQASIKLVLAQREIVDADRSALAVQLIRHQLMSDGVDAEWLLKGASLYLSRHVDRGMAQIAAEEGIGELIKAAEDQWPYALDSLPSDAELDAEEHARVDAFVWDTIRYLVYTHGEDALWSLLDTQSTGVPVAQVFEQVTGQSLDQFTHVWQSSLLRAHTLPAWEQVAEAFDPESALAHVLYLANDALLGRQPGSPAALAAAEYVATKFSEYGLVSLPGIGDGGFLQRFPISYTTLLEAPHLELSNGYSDEVVPLVYRQDFVDLVHETAGSGQARGDLVWVRDQDYGGLDLDGKVVLRVPTLVVTEEIALAEAHGAGGLVLVGKIAGQKRPLSKKSLPASMPVTATIPVLELTQNGYDKVLDLIGETESSLSSSPPAVPFDVQAHLWISLDDLRSVEAVNVLGLLAGSDRDLADEIIVFSTHYDHVGDDPGTWVCPEGLSAINEPRDPGCVREPGMRYPGANDNASGVGVMLEILRLWEQSGYHPRRSVLFAAWGAQEAEQAGMEYYMGHPLLPLEQTVAVMHMEAVGGGEGYYLGAQGARTREAYLRSTIQCAEDLLDGRLTITSPPRNDPARLYREAGIPTLWLSWREASDENWPAEHADLVEPYRLGVTGRMVTLALMALAQ